MDNFFNFIDKINKPMFVLYDKNFIHINEYLLSSLGFTTQNRPGSLTQIIEPKWKNRLIALKIDEEIDIPLIMNGGKIKSYRVRMYPLEIEKSEYICFILSVKDVIDQNLDIANRIFSRLPFAAFIFDKEFEIIQKNNILVNMEKVKVDNFKDLKKIFPMDENPNFHKNDHYSFLSTDKEFELFLFKPLPGLSYNYFTGIISQTTQFEKGIDITYVKNSISQSIQRLINVQKIYSDQSNITESIWEGMHNEITSLSKVKRHLETELIVPDIIKNDVIHLNDLIINELEILKSNEIFKNKVKLITQFSESIKPVNEKYSNIAGLLIPLIDRIAEVASQFENTELYIETIKEDDLSWIKVYINTASKSSKNQPIIFKELQKYKNQFEDVEVKFDCNINSKKNIDLSLGFEI